MNNEVMAYQVRKKGKSLCGCIGALLKWSYKNRKTVDKKILKAAGITGRVDHGEPGMATAKKIIADYYMGGAKG